MSPGHAAETALGSLEPHHPCGEPGSEPAELSLPRTRVSTSPGPGQPPTCIPGASSEYSESTYVHMHPTDHTHAIQFAQMHKTHNMHVCCMHVTHHVCTQRGAHTYVHTHTHHQLHVTYTSAHTCTGNTHQPQRLSEAATHFHTQRVEAVSGLDRRSDPRGAGGRGGERWPQGTGQGGKKEGFISGPRIHYKLSGLKM